MQAEPTMKAAAETAEIAPSEASDSTSGGGCGGGGEDGGAEIMMHDDALFEGAASSLQKATAIPSSTSTSTLPPPAASKKRGPPLILVSIACAAAAGGMTVGRWLMTETGEVMLLFAEELSAGAGEVCTGDAMDGVDSDLTLQCVDVDQGVLESAGRALLAVASSPYLRSAPLGLIFLSSTALVVGLILTHRELQQCLSWLRSCREYGEECSRQLMALAGAENANELTVRLNKKQLEIKSAFWERARQAVECMDGLVLDDVLQRWIRMGVDFSMGVWGGLVLYSIPDEIFEGSPNGARGTRRRLIRAADQSLEQMIFRPGGAWDAFPPQLRNVLSPKMLADTSESVGGQEETDATSSLESKDSSDNDEGSSDTPLASPVPLANDAGVSNNDQHHTLVHYARVICTEGKDNVSSGGTVEGSRETIADAISATVNDLVVSNFTRTGLPSDGKESRDGGNNDKLQTQQQEEHQQVQQPKPSLPPPRIQLEKYLHRASVAATFLFLCHLRSSPTTRKAWGSAARFMTSLGLASTAIGAGVASAVLNSNAPADTLATNPIVAQFCSKILDCLRASANCALPTDVRKRLHWVLGFLREEMRKNRRLQSTLALMVVLYGMKRLTGKKGMCSPNAQIRRGIQ